MPSYSMKTNSPYKKLPEDIPAFVESLLIYIYMSISVKFSYIR